MGAPAGAATVPDPRSPRRRCVLASFTDRDDGNTPDGDIPGLEARRMATLRTARLGAACLFLAVAAGLWVPPAGAEERAGTRVVRSLYEARTHNVVLQQWDLSCGAAALATVLRYQHGEDVAERDVAVGLIDRPAYYAEPGLVRARQGFSFLDMRRYLERLGYDGVGLGRMRFRDLLERAPLIVPVDPGDYPHFVVFRGATPTHVLLADPAFGNVTLTREQFQRAWIDYPEIGKVGFVVHDDGRQAPPGALAPRAEEFVLLR